MVQDSWKITTMDVRNIIDNNDGYREGVVRRLREEMRRRGWLPGQDNYRTVSEYAVAQVLGAKIRARISDLGESYLIPDTLVHEFWTLALNRVNWTELGAEYYRVIDEEG